MWSEVWQSTQTIKKAAADDGFVTYSELRENLKHSNFSDIEIDLFFQQFKEDPELSDMIKDDEDLDEEMLEEERLRILEEEEELDESLSQEELSDSESQFTSSFASSRPMSGREHRQLAGASWNCGAAALG